MKYTGTKLVDLNHFLILQIYNLIVRILYTIKPNFSLISTLLIIIITLERSTNIWMQVYLTLTC